MPYYRITLNLKHPEQSITAIRFYEKADVDYIQLWVRNRAQQKYVNRYVDIEATMLPRHCTAVHQFLEEESRRKENRKSRGKETTRQTIIKTNRKKGKEGPALGEREL